MNHNLKNHWLVPQSFTLEPWQAGRIMEMAVEATSREGRVVRPSVIMRLILSDYFRREATGSEKG